MLRSAFSVPQVGRLKVDYLVLKTQNLEKLEQFREEWSDQVSEGAAPWRSLIASLNRPREPQRHGLCHSLR